MDTVYNIYKNTMQKDIHSMKLWHFCTDSVYVCFKYNITYECAIENW